MPASWNCRPRNDQLTALGHGLYRAFEPISAWADGWAKEIKDALRERSEHDPEAGTGFPKRSSSHREMERDGDLKINHPALVRVPDGAIQ